MTSIKFKYANMTKDSFLENLRFAAKDKRNQAHILMRQADAVDDVINQIDNDIEELE